MEQNFPFSPMTIINNGYNKRILPVLKKLDDGDFFKIFINIFLRILAVGSLIIGFILTIKGIFGDFGFIKLRISNSQVTDSGQKLGSGIGLIAGFILSIIVSWILYSVIKKRNEQLNEQPYSNLLNYLFIKTIPRLLLLNGEVLFILVLHVGILQILAALLGGYVYVPLGNFPSAWISVLFPFMSSILPSLNSDVQGNFDYFTSFFQLGVWEVIGAFLMLITVYVIKEIYDYFMKYLTNFFGWLLEFSIRYQFFWNNKDAVNINNKSEK